jgi:hypothetical protein
MDQMQRRLACDAIEGAPQRLAVQATTPRRPSAKRCMKRVKETSNAFGSSRRNTRLKASWLGVPCRRRKNWRKYGALISPNSAMSEQSSLPGSRVQSAIINTSCRP